MPAPPSAQRPPGPDASWRRRPAQRRPSAPPPRSRRRGRRPRPAGPSRCRSRRRHAPRRRGGMSRMASSTVTSTSVVAVSGGVGARCSGTWKCTRHGPSAGSESSASERSSAASTDSVGPELAGLVEVARLAEARDRGAADRVGRLLHVERRRRLHLHDPQAGIGDPAQRGRRIGERHREVAGVEADADELGIDQARARARGEPSDHVVDGVEHAARLGFDGEPHGAAGLVAERAQLARHERHGLGRRAVVRPRSTARARRAGASRCCRRPPSGRRSASTLAQSRVWATPAGVGPVGTVDVELHDVGVERAVREGVDGPQDEAVDLQSRLQTAAVLRLAASAGRELRREPESHAEPVQAGRPAHRAREGVELFEHPVEVLGGMHVGAVRQLHQALAPRSTELPSKVTGAGGAASLKPGTGSRCRRPLCP